MQVEATDSRRRKEIPRGWMMECRESKEKWMFEVIAFPAAVPKKKTLWPFPPYAEAFKWLPAGFDPLSQCKDFHRWIKKMPSSCTLQL